MRMWEIRESLGKYDSERTKSKTDKEAYECGYEDGYEAAVKEFEEVASSYKRYR